MRRVLLVAATAALTLAAIEGIALLGLRAVSGAWPSHAALQVERDARRAGVLGGVAPDEIQQRQELGVQRALHPYLGWVKDADHRETGVVRTGDPQAHDLGFPDNAGPILYAPDPERLVVALLGGSVANDFARKAGAQLLEQLAALPRFRGREPVLVSLALPGYKQPQQLMALTWFLTLGAHFDLVIAIDGYNELISGAYNAVAGGVFHAYPKRWHERVGDLTGELRLALGEVAFLQQRRAERAELFSRAPLRWSLASGLVWKRLDGALEARVAAAQARAQQGDRLESYQVRGPRMAHASEPLLLDEIAGLWQRSSLQAHRLATAHGAEYHHFLQPNQYVEGSKVFSADELAKALQRGSQREGWVREGYPKLQREGRRLREQGVPFHDLTDVFRSVEQTVYIDICCHVNRFGNRLLADAIARTLAPAPGGA